MLLADKTALIVGASRGIGEAIARGFVANGAKVLLVARDAAALEALARDLDPAGARVKFATADVSDGASLEKAVAAAVAAFGRLDLAVNNAGVQIPRTPFTELTEESFERVVTINLKGVFLAMQHEIRAMMAGGGGAIVNVSSAAGLVGFPLIAPYVASKHGVIGLTKSAALEYAARGIRVNALVPGTVMTDMLRMGPASSPEALAAITAKVPMGRIANPDEMAGAVIWLCSDQASYVTGTALPVDGGYVVP